MLLLFMFQTLLASYFKLRFEKHELTNEANLSAYTHQASHQCPLDIVCKRQMNILSLKLGAGKLV